MYERPIYIGQSIEIYGTYTTSKILETEIVSRQWVWDLSVSVHG